MCGLGAEVGFKRMPSVGDVLEEISVVRDMWF